MANQVRTFIAVDIEDEVRERAQGLMSRFNQRGAKVKWVEPENLHVTLLFLGEVEMLAIPKICQVVRQQARTIAPFTLRTEGVGSFPHIRRPKILWLGISEGADELKTLHDRLEPPLMDLGWYRREEREYTPHLTLGRANNDCDIDALSELVREYPEWSAGFTQVREILIMGSELRRGGPVYTVLGRAACGRDAEEA